MPHRRDQPLRDRVDWDHPVVLTQDDIENAQKKQESTYGDQPLRRDTVRWDSPVVLSAEDIEEAQKLKSAAKDNPLRDTVRWDSPVVLSGEDIEGAQKLKAAATDNPLRDTVRWDSPLVLKAEDFELITPKPPKNATDTNSSTTSNGLTRAKDRPLKQRDDPGEEKPIGVGRAKDTPIVPSDSVFSNAISQYGAFTDSGGVLHRPRSRSPFTKPGLWEANPDNPHNRDHANKYWYRPESVNIDWLSGQLAWGAHYAVPAAGVGGTDGFSTVHFPTIGTFLNIPDDYD